jgi:photosystem II stability/assembly factor-like uncharacterized protein
MRITPAVLVASFALAAVMVPTQKIAADDTPQFTELTMKSMKFRQIGPANTSGRVDDVAVDPKNSSVIYVAEATGGLYKSENDGTTWDNVFAKQPVASVGSVAISPSKPDVVWAGTGEANSRNSNSWGDGIYVSRDGGATWNRSGLQTSKTIGRIVVDPKNTDIVWAAATGDPFGPGGERGVYKTTDAGKTWTGSLVTDANTGAVDVAVNPSDPNVVLAAMWERRRNAYSLHQGGPTDGLYRTIDGGKSWQRVTAGIPGDTERIGVAFSVKNPKIAYAVVASSALGPQGINSTLSNAGGIFRSDDMGATWKRMSGYDPRPFYFSQIRVDPSDADHVFELNYDLGRSHDGGKTVRDLNSQSVHSDWHALWIDPKDSGHMVAGTDGGVYISRDGGETWRYSHNLATGEFYALSYDFARPYNVCGGLQDNQSWCGPHSTNDDQGITDMDWVGLPGGDGFYTAQDPRRPWIVWSESQNGFATRGDLRSGSFTFLRPDQNEGTSSYRFNWDSPLALDRFDPDIAYLAGNHLIKLTDDGKHGVSISPDLSKHLPGTTETAGSGAETYGTIVSFTQSPIDRRIFWAGTDDGNVQLTRDGGATWTDLSANLPVDVRTEWVTRIDASHFVAGRAYVAINGKYHDDFAPHAFMTDDFGATWTSISAGLPSDGPTYVVREDPFNQDLLFAGTEFALWLSRDRGAHWMHLSAGLPTVAVTDVQVHPRDRDLIVATHGAALWVLDDIEGLEGLTEAEMAKPAALFDMRTPYEVYYVGTNGPTDDEFNAENAPRGLIVNYYIKSYTGDSVSIAIKDAKKHSVQTLTGQDYPGLNRVVWDLHPKTPASSDPENTQFQQPFVAPGTYTVTLTVGKTSVSKTVQIRSYDPAWAGLRLR